MPRRRPGALRAVTPAPVRLWAFDDPRLLDRLSPPTAAAIHILEHTGRHYPHLLPGGADDLLRRYAAFGRRGDGRVLLRTSDCPCPGCEYDDMSIVRDGLEVIAVGLPPRARTEIRRLIGRLDRRFLRRTILDPARDRDWAGDPTPWWHRRAHERC